MIFEKISGDAHNPAHVFAALELRREGGWLHRRDSERESPRVTRRSWFPSFQCGDRELRYVIGQTLDFLLAESLVWIEPLYHLAAVEIEKPLRRDAERTEP